MKKPFYLLALLPLLTACGQMEVQSMPEAGELNAETRAVENAAHESSPEENTTKVALESTEDVPDGTLDQPTLREFYANPPKGLCQEDYLTEMEVWDESNYYLKVSDHVAGNSMPSYSYCEMAIFLNTEGGYNVYGVIDVVLVPMMAWGDVAFFNYIDGEWVDITEEVNSKIDRDLILERATESIKAQNPAWLDDSDSELILSNYVPHLPEFGTVIEFVHQLTNDVLYKLKWNGEEFIVIE